MKQLAALIVFWIVISLMSTNILASTPTNNHELIEWKNKELSGTGGRSIDLIFGYVEKDIVSIYLYESPTKATVSIVAESGSIVYENTYDSPKNIEIDMNNEATGSYEVRVTYSGKMYIGTFLIE